MKIFTEGNQFFKSIIADLMKAENTLYLEYYIFRYDELGKSIVDILIEKAKEGVDIRIIADEAGGTSRKMIRKMRENYISVEILFLLHVPFFKVDNLRAN